MISMDWGTIPKLEDFIKQCEGTDSIPYEMELVPEDYRVVAEAVNQGICSRLEAISLVGEVEEAGGPFPKGKLAIADAASLRTLVRRLRDIGMRQWSEDDRLPLDERQYENENPPGADLASAIMSTLDYEWV